MQKSYPWNSPYAYAENRVIDRVDIEGLEYATVVFKYYCGKTKPVFEVEWHNDLQHNEYGPMGKGVAFRSERYGKDGSLTSTSSTSFYERSAGPGRLLDHGFYYGPTQLPNVYVVRKYMVESVDDVDEAGRIHDAACDDVYATADNATKSWGQLRQMRRFCNL